MRKAQARALAGAACWPCGAFSYELCLRMALDSKLKFNPSKEMFMRMDVFRRSEDIPPVLEQVLAIKDQVKLKVLWLQQGISHAASEQAASAAGLEVVSDACIKTEHCSANL